MIPPTAPFLTGLGQLARPLARGQREQRVVLLPAGGTAVEMGTQPGNGGVGVEACEPKLDELVKPVEALLTPDLRARRAEQPLQRATGGVVLVVHRLACKAAPWR